MKGKHILGIVIAALIIIITTFFPLPEGLSREGLVSIGMIFVAISLLAFECFPLGITSLLIIALCPTLGLMTISSAWVNFGSVSVFFIIATSAITTILLKTSIPIRLIDKMLDWAKGEPKKFVFAFLVATALFSAVMSNIPITMAFLGFAIVMIDAMEAKPLESNFAKCLMIGVPAGAMIGGMMTPIGTTVNIVAMDFLGRLAGVNISFFQWMVVGIPCSIVILFFTYFSLIWIFKPEPIPAKAISAVKEQTVGHTEFTAYEYKTIAILSLMFVLWFLGGFFPALNTTIIAIFGLTVMFLPKVDLLAWSEFNRDVPWGVVLIVGAVNVIAAAFLGNGSGAYIATWFVEVTAGSSALILAFLLSLFFVIFNAVFPMGPASVGLLAPPVLTVVIASGILTPAFTTLSLAVAAGATFMIPINLLYLITWDKGFFTFMDVVKSGILPSIGVLLSCVFIIEPLVRLLGLA